jgi:hypothetical protein
MIEVSPLKADATRLMQTAEALCALGEKRAGSEEEARAAEIICDRLRSYGLAPTVHEFDNYISFPTRTELRLGGPSGQAFPAVGVAFGGETGPQGIEAALVDVGFGKPADYAGRDIDGRAVLIRGIPTYDGVARARDHAACAIVYMTDGPQRHKMTLSPVWGSPASEAEVGRMPRLPVATVNKPDGTVLAEAITAGETHIHMIAEHFEGWRTVRLPVVDFPGKEPEFVLLGSHYCTWFEGSTDNVTANALLVEVARLMVETERQGRYGLRIAWWPGHTHGRYSGSAIYADAFWQELRDRAIIYFNVDSVGTRDATLCMARNQMAEISDFSARMLKELVPPLSDRDKTRMARQWKRPEASGDITRPSRSSDQSFWGVGLPSLQIVSMLPDGHPDRSPTISGSGGAWWWHAAEETLDKIGPEILARDTDVHFRMIHEIVHGTLLPLHLRATSNEIKGVLAEYDEAAGERMDLSVLWSAWHRFDTAVAGLAARGESMTEPHAAARHNRTLLAVTRLVNPVLYQAGSEFAQDPATKTRLLPGLAGLLDLPPEGSDALKFCKIALRRQINRTVDALIRASRRIEQDQERNTTKNATQHTIER